MLSDIWKTFYASGMSKENLFSKSYGASIWDHLYFNSDVVNALVLKTQVVSYPVFLIPLWNLKSWIGIYDESVIPNVVLDKC